VGDTKPSIFCRTIIGFEIHPFPWQGVTSWQQPAIFVSDVVLMGYPNVDWKCVHTAVVTWKSWVLQEFKFLKPGPLGREIRLTSIILSAMYSYSLLPNLVDISWTVHDLCRKKTWRQKDHHDR